MLLLVSLIIVLCLNLYIDLMKFQTHFCFKLKKYAYYKNALVEQGTRFVHLHCKGIRKVF